MRQYISRYNLAICIMGTVYRYIVIHWWIVTSLVLSYRSLAFSHWYIFPRQQGTGRIYTCTVRSSESESVSETPTELCLHYIRGSDPRSSEAMAILEACSSDHAHGHLWACALHDLGRPRPRNSLRARTRTSETKVSDTDSDQCKHETSIHLFWLRPNSDSDARTEISDVV